MSSDFFAVDDEDLSDAESSTMLYNSVISFARSSSSRIEVPSNVTKEVYDSFIRDGPHLFFFICCLFLMVGGTILNSLTIATIFSLPPRIRQDATHTFILNLSIADLLLSLFVLPSHWLQIVFRKVEVVGEVLCDISQMTFFWIFELSLFTLSVVSINRMVKICYNPSYSRIFTRTVIRFLIAFLWIFSFILVLPPAIGFYGSYEIFNGTRGNGKYYCGLANTSHSMISPSAFYYTIGFFVPFLTFSIAYWKIYQKVKEHVAHFRASNSDARSYKLFQTIAVIFVSFIVCYLPNLIFRGWMSYTAKFRYLRQLVKALMYSSAVLNPLIYFTMNIEYQSAFRRLVNRTKQRLNLRTGAVVVTTQAPDSKSSDREADTGGTPLDGSSCEGPEVGTRMSGVRRPDSPKDIVICYAALVGFLLICALIADFIRHRNISPQLLERMRLELTDLD